MNEFEKRVVEELEAIRREVSSIESWCSAGCILLLMIWVHGCR